ncbi:ankyrin repeat and SOCS box protein 13-like [Uloborus diversus]|uniref:ankyrin repeat and SOCS box protein 13-like n=1 Tax=Uloborus diversus TaxID=327109 RepID=UPI00240A790B|nr:ankyrin repeat and SOCS box protein 13-like [Uloborus diversus]
MASTPQNVNAILDAYGVYPLHKAAALGHKENLITLLESGLSPNAPNYDCLTPLHEACIQNQPECAEILINYGSKVNATSLDGGTPLCDACAGGSLLCAQLLVKMGAEINPPFALSTPLHEACLKGSVECVEFLINAGARLNVNDCNFGTPLHAATLRHRTDCVRKLLQSGASVNATKIHETALHVAVREQFPEIVEILIEYGANIFASNNQNKLPIDLLAEAEGHIYNLLTHHSAEPASLKDVCRRKIRLVLGSERLKYVRELKLPKRLTSYLSHELQEYDL